MEKDGFQLVTILETEEQTEQEIQTSSSDEKRREHSPNLKWN